MEENRTYLKIGIFILGGLAVLIGGIVYINADVIRGEALLVETYLDESVQGLSVGSQVLYRGVAIGQVKEITFVPLVYDLGSDLETHDKFGRYVMIVSAIKSDQFPGFGDDRKQLEAGIAHQVKSGLRFKLSYQGITGIVYLEADYFAGLPEPLDVPWTPKHIYVPSTPSLMTSFTTAANKIFRRIENIDIEAVFTKMELTLDTITKTLDDAKISEIRQGILNAAEEFGKTNQDVRAFLEHSQDVPEDFKTALQQFERTLSRIEMVVQNNEPNLEIVLSDMKDLVRNLKRFSEDIKEDPAQLLFSNPPKPSERVQ